MLKIGLIGAGSMGNVHNSCYSLLKRDHDVTVTAIADLRPQMREQAKELWPDASIYNDGSELLEKENLDAVDICLPTYLHAMFAKAAMEKGCDVFIEKPLCLSTEDAEMLLETQKKHGSRVMIGHVLHFLPEYTYLKEVKESGRYGELKSLVMQRLMGRGGSGGWEGWFQNLAKSGSVIVDLHIHDADFIRRILGEPKKFSLSARDNGNGFFEQITALFDYENKFVSAEAAWDYTKGFPFTASYRAGFEKAAIVFDSTGEAKLKVYTPDGKMLVPELEQNKDEGIKKFTGYYDELKYFCERCIEKKQIESCTLEDGVKTIKLVLSELLEAQKQHGGGIK